MKPTALATSAILPALLLGISLGASGCEDSQDQLLNVNLADTACQNGSAQILVQDGFLERLCGCQEAGATQVVPPSSLTCTVSAGTVVFFLYLGTTQSHQIVSTASPSFVSSPVSNPAANPPFQVYGTAFQNSGSYAFQDSYNSSVNGTIIVP